MYFIISYDNNLNHSHNHMYVITSLINLSKSVLTKDFPKYSVVKIEKEKKEN